MEELQLDYATLVSVYQTKVSDLTNQVIIAEAKNLILSKKLQELCESSNYSDDSSDAVVPSTRKKAAGTTN